MIRHVVLVRFDSAVSQAEQADLFAALHALVPQIPGMLSFAAGANVSPEGLARGFSHAFTADFADEQARDAYLAYPAHKAAGARLVAAAAGGLDGLTVLDFACGEAAPR